MRCSRILGYRVYKELKRIFPSIEPRIEILKIIGNEAEDLTFIYKVRGRGKEFELKIIPYNTRLFDIDVKTIRGVYSGFKEFKPALEYGIPTAAEHGLLQEERRVERPIITYAHVVEVRWNNSYYKLYQVTNENNTRTFWEDAGIIAIKVCDWIKEKFGRYEISSEYDRKKNVRYITWLKGAIYEEKIKPIEEEVSKIERSIEEAVEEIEEVMEESKEIGEALKISWVAGTEEYKKLKEELEKAIKTLRDLETKYRLLLKRYEEKPRYEERLWAREVPEKVTLRKIKVEEELEKYKGKPPLWKEYEKAWLSNITGPGVVTLRIHPVNKSYGIIFLARYDEVVEMMERGGVGLFPELVISMDFVSSLLNMVGVEFPYSGLSTPTYIPIVLNGHDTVEIDVDSGYYLMFGLLLGDEEYGCATFDKYTGVKSIYGIELSKKGFPTGIREKIGKEYVTHYIKERNGNQLVSVDSSIKFPLFGYSAYWDTYKILRYELSDKSYSVFRRDIPYFLSKKTLTVNRIYPAFWLNFSGEVMKVRYAPRDWYVNHGNEIDRYIGVLINDSLEYRSELVSIIGGPANVYLDLYVEINHGGIHNERKDLLSYYLIELMYTKNYNLAEMIKNLINERDIDVLSRFQYYTVYGNKFLKVGYNGEGLEKLEEAEIVTEEEEEKEEEESEAERRLRKLLEEREEEEEEEFEEEEGGEEW